ncbi:PAS domain-containing protein [Winogradskyella sp. UBA3174]|uniref:PAS domain-containing protein n=1 Tax=Winogradskyella sp. UBA3174 TaxID=1947785 RepID=UPI0025CF5463|nr:PAS domain-containing protein [Winogradskyella sp. UBA3174]|tara:strand:+ start:16658 stop:17224 length:567 start_codon:yes stop_codon:yes gene_type:complete
MAYNLSKMAALDLYLSSLSEKEYDKIKHQLNTPEASTMPLMSWDLFSENHFKTLKKLKMNTDINTVKAFAEKAKWKNELDSIFKNQNFEALIITDSEQKIQWVNDGFTEMTGYSKKHALNKTPRFLQGPSTSQKTKTKIRTQLTDLKPFKGIITNYRKDNSLYKCEVKIIPMYSQEVTHFLAIEKLVV